MGNVSYYYLNFIFNCFFLVIFLIYFIIFIVYALFSLRRKYSPRIISYWIEYCVFNVLVLIYIITYLVYLIHIKDKVITSEEYELNCSDSYITSYCFMFNLIISLISFEIFFFLLGDSIQSILLCIGITNIVQIKQPDVRSLKSQFNGNYAMNTSNPKRILILHGVNLLCVIVQVALFIFLFPNWSDTSIKGKSGLFVIIKIFRLIHLIGMILISFLVYTLKYYKQRLMENDYYSSNLVMQATYNLNVAKIVFYNDFLTYKSLIDFVVNVPLLLFVCLKRFSETSLVVTYTCFIAYFMFGGGIFAHFDKIQKVRMVKGIKRFFLFHRMKFDFGAKEKAKLFEEYLLDIDSRSRLFNDYDMSGIGEEIFDINDLDNEESNQEELKAVHYNFIDYYTIFSSLFQFFNDNQKAYKSLETNKSSLGSVSKSMTSLNKYSIEAIYQEDDDLLDEFNKNYPNKNRFSIEFNLESYYNESMLKLYQLNQIDIKDILSSLDLEKNRVVAQAFIDKKSCDKLFNGYTTHDSLLYYELYDSYTFPIKEIKAFYEQYIQYLEQLSNSSQGTYLPLLIGIFKLSYASYESFIVLYKSPLSFTAYIEISYWLKSTLSESQEKISMSSTTSNAIDISIIDLKNCIQFKEDKIKAIKSQIESDLDAIKSFPFVSFSKLNMFVLKESKNYNAKFIDSFDDLYGKDSLLSENSQQGSHLAENDTAKMESYISVKNTSLKKEYNINTINSFDILYGQQLENESFICKIYLSDIFRNIIDEISTSPKSKKHKHQQKHKNKSVKDNTSYYTE